MAGPYEISPTSNFWGDKIMIRKRSMDWSHSIMATGLAALLLVVGMTPAAYAQQRRRPAPGPVSVYGQGYQKGYADGFAQGTRDWTRGVPRDWQRSDGYEQRENSYSPRLRSSEEYTQGYDLGFEMGHTDGYYGRTRNAAVPANALVLAKAAALADAQRAREQAQDQGQGVPRDRDRDRSRRASAALPVPEDMELRIQLTTPIDTKNNRVGDTFSANVIMPAAYEGAKVDGHIANVNRSGRVSGKTELSLAFDSITLPDGHVSPLKADLVRVIESENVKKVDEEGQVESGSRTKDSTVRGGVGATAGAIIGGIAGGAKGAILGAILGGAAGVGTVYVEGNKDLILDRGTEMVIRTAGRTR
jgi:hypothetical protein